MKLLNTYEDKDEAEKALTKISGDKRLASERDSTVVIYNLFGTPSWGDLYKLGMFNLPELQNILELGKTGQPIDMEKYNEYIKMLSYAARAFYLAIPRHCL
ncbi:hypothetical protein ABEH00_08410 [Pantoea agglomerans]|uniref:hypothetical protein n=1 Tax=Enterobacter agglomerans TaxID=549 RepID=UPI00165452DA|nr:hypothetical protein [Pantoea agglomerans]